mmetsp:Transcript_1149/g.4533  ORF Transcript_1149/g.4533 Transcript_1149/m.4533 type:complete len:283 (+) Transcript_1149:1746-2594(+)
MVDALGPSSVKRTTSRVSRRSRKKCPSFSFSFASGRAKEREAENACAPKKRRAPDSFETASHSTTTDLSPRNAAKPFVGVFGSLRPSRSGPFDDAFPCREASRAFALLADAAKEREARTSRSSAATCAASTSDSSNEASTSSPTYDTTSETFSFLSTFFLSASFASASAGPARNTASRAFPGSIKSPRVCVFEAAAERGTRTAGCRQTSFRPSSSDASRRTARTKNVSAETFRAATRTTRAAGCVADAETRAFISRLGVTCIRASTRASLYRRDGGAGSGGS